MWQKLRLRLRRLRTDLVEVFKIFHGATCLQKSKFFEVDNDQARGHSLKLHKTKCNCDVRKYYFSNRVVDPWNSLSETTIHSTSISQFKQCLKQNTNLVKFLKGEFL